MAKQHEPEFDDFDLPDEDALPDPLADLDEPDAMPDLSKPGELSELSEPAELSDLGEGDPLSDVGGSDELAAPEPLSDLSDLMDLEVAPPEPAAIETEGAEEEAAEAVEEKTAAQPTGGKARMLDRLPGNRELIVAIAAPVLLVLLWLVGLINISTIVYLAGVALVPYGLWRYRTTSTIYTVLMGCAVVAIMTALLMLWREWGSYGFDVKVRALHPNASIQRAGDQTTALRVC